MSDAPQTSNHPVVVGLLWSCLGAAFAAGYLVPYKAAVVEVGPAGLVLPMLLCAAVINSGLEALGRLRQMAQSTAGPWRWDGVTLVVALLLGGASALGNEAVCQSLVSLNPGLVSVTLRTQVVFVAIGGLVLLREPLGVRFWIGLVLAMAGFVYLQGQLDLGGSLSGAGIAWAVVGAAGFGSMQVVIRRAIHRIDLLQVNTLRLWLAAALVALLPGRVTTLFTLDGRIWAFAATAALCGPVLSRLCLMRALRTLPAAHATLALFMAPVFAYVLTGLLLGTWPTTTELVGSLVILGAIALPVTELTRRGRPETATEA
jgi:drug/metabolite transporter (DMT)-like permease